MTTLSFQISLLYNKSVITFFLGVVSVVRQAYRAPNSAAKLQPLAHLQYEKSDILSQLTLHFALTPPTEKFRPLCRILSDIISLPTAAVIITVGMSFRPQQCQTPRFYNGRHCMPPSLHPDKHPLIPTPTPQKTIKITILLHIRKKSSTFA